MGKQVFASHIAIQEDDIQGDILVGLQKKAEIFIFFTISDSHLFKTGLKALLPRIATTKQTRLAEAPPHPGDAVKVNIAFSAHGLQLLGHSAPASADPSFLAGMKAEADAVLGDDVAADWQPAYKVETFDGVLLVAAFDNDAVRALALANQRVDAIKAGFGKAGGSDVLFEAHREEGRLNVHAPGHEVFGFADGVSQPAVEGLHQPITDDDQSLAGQDIVRLGDFILGNYEMEMEKPDGTAEVATPPAPWMANGSYLVFRRLTQHVDTFNAYVQANYHGLADSPDQFGARLIGRWKDGSPIARDPLRPNPAHDEKAAMENNDFEFGIAKVGQGRCPFNSHIRRVYPRSDIQSGIGNAEARRILRAGIAFDNTDSTPGDLGLLFVCYQSSIVDKFRFIQSDWANATSIPFEPAYTGDAAAMMPASPGIDLIIGQQGPRDADWTVDSGAGPTKALTNVPKFVTATGGGYFFSPSLTGLATLAT